MPKSQQKPGTSRQRPISCQFCRTRKLRCSRTAPCSNCISRGVTCDLENPVPQPSSISGSITGNSDNSEIIERLRRLENLLVAQREERQGQNGQTSDIAGSWTRPVYPSASPIPTQTMDVDSDKARMRDVYMEQTKSLQTKIIFRICPSGQINKAQSYIFPYDSTFIKNPQPVRCVWLPPHAEAQILLEKYIRIASNLPYVTHLPSLMSVLEAVYAGVSGQTQLQPGQVILLLSIFAAATYFWVQNDCDYGLFSASAEANKLSALWIHAAEDVLSVTCRSPKVSIEAVQGVIIMAYVAALIEGLHRYRILFSIGLAIARDLGLHRVDHPSNVGIANTAQAEMGRRVWWYLCASDWAMAARTGGMGESIYSCHPRQMITRKPLNIDDENVFDGMSRDERPLSQPTTMSYSILSIRQAEISRSIVDRGPLTMASTSGMSHDTIMDIDTELQTFINDVPAFYSMSKSALMETYGLTQSQSENIFVQGKMIYFSLYLQRCKLHLPYLARSFNNSTYSSSREICIKYARLILRSELWQGSLDIDAAMLFKFTGLLVGAFLACIVLLMDLCVKPTSPPYQQQREEVHKAFRLVEAAKNESDTTGKFVDSLVSILRKYNTSPLSPVPEQQQQPEAMSHGDITPNTRQTATNEAWEHTGNTDPGISGGEPRVEEDHDLMVADELLNEDGEDLSMYWTDFTQSFDQGIDVNSFDWDSIFSELDSSFL